MLGDIALIIACGVLLHYSFWSPIAWLMAGLTFCIWRDNGGFQAWSPKVIRQFMAVAKKHGL